MSEDSVETEKVKCKKDVVKHRRGRAEVGVCSSQQQQTHAKYSERSNSENTKQGDWRIESATTFKSVLLNKTVEESLIYRKKYTLSKDVHTAVCGRSPSRKNVKSRRKSEKDLTSLDLKQKQVSFWFFGPASPHANVT